MSPWDSTCTGIGTYLAVCIVLASLNTFLSNKYKKDQPPLEKSYFDIKNDFISLEIKKKENVII